jgi:RimJ/RimL family protein N-acetyltransferase
VRAEHVERSDAGYRPFFEPPELQLLYGLLTSVWGRGLATEAAERWSMTALPNTASLRVLERLGMAEWKRTDEGTDGTRFFHVTRAGWTRRIGR